MKYLVTVHDGGGSMGEAMQPNWSAVVDTEEEATALETKIWELNEDDEYFYDGLVIIHPIDDSVSVDDALKSFKDSLGEEDEDPEEAALHAKVDGLMAGETAKLDDMFKDTYHQPRQTYIQQDHTFTRYPPETGYTPYQGMAMEDPLDFEEGGEGDPFGDLTAEEFEGLDDGTFLDILHKRLTVEDYRTRQKG